MPPYAICCSKRCDYVFDCTGKDNASSLLPTRRCPTCRSRLIFYCRFCGSTIVKPLDMSDPCCWKCTGGLRDNASVPQDTQDLVTRGANTAVTQDGGVAFSGRERDVLELLAMGNCNKEVATILGISVKTVESYRWRIMLKISAPSLTHLVHYAIRHKIVELQG
jgi:DNA-binding CsgD family transcriptional regulator